eukprot:5282720-Alexandrium_andersonii.AAC.1
MCVPRTPGSRLRPTIPRRFGWLVPGAAKARRTRATNGLQTKMSTIIMGLLASGRSSRHDLLGFGL